MRVADDDSVAAVLLQLVAERGAGKTICPSEVARHLAGSDPQQWRRLMVPIRRVAVALHKAGTVTIRRKGKPVTDPDTFAGIYRLGLPPS